MIGSNFVVVAESFMAGLGKLTDRLNERGSGRPNVLKHEQAKFLLDRAKVPFRLTISN